ncbi:MAG: DUF2332 domain-containing protein [Egibacteraceae bacterium]
MGDERAAPSSASVVAGAGPAPSTDDPMALTGWQLRTQAAACATMGSPLYAALLRSAAVDVEAAGPVWSVLAPHVVPGRGDALALRLMAAAHRLVLTHRAPALAVHYPSVGGEAGPDGAWPAFAELCEERRETLVELVASPCQTNEVGRAAGLAGGFLEVAGAAGLPLRVLEVGASAGLNLRWDRFRYGGGGRSWGPPDSPVDLTGHWREPPPCTDVAVQVVERAGCDRRPVDPTSAEGRLAVTASVWADQTSRFERLRGALALAQQVPATVDRASLDEWVADRLAERLEGVATVLYHSVVAEYLEEDVRSRFRRALHEAGERATASAPLAWLRLEPVSALRHHGVTLTTWPGGEERILARCGAHGTDVVWLGG